MALKATTIILVVVILLLIYVIYNYVKKSKDVTLLNLANAEDESTFPASELSDSTSSNYAISIWFYINDWNYRIGETKTILERTGEEDVFSPSIALGANTNNVTVSMTLLPLSGTETTTHECVVNDIPLQRWTNMIMSINGKALDIYIDGKLIKTCILGGVPKILNKAPIKVTPGGGFSGYTGRLQYFSSPLNPTEAYDIYKDGFDGSDSIFAGLGRYRLKFAFMEDNKELNSFQL